MEVQHKPTKRKQYSSEFKREAVRLVTEGGLSIAQAARDLGLDDNMVSRWKKEAAQAEQNGQRAFPGQGHPQDEELSRLRREVEVLRQEREILKKAISIFSQVGR
jgi:transposase